MMSGMDNDKTNASYATAMTKKTQETTLGKVTARSFDDLALELRKKIYHEALVSDDRPNVALLRVNKRTHAEAKEIFGKENQFIHITTNFLNVFLAKDLEPVPFTNLARDDALLNPGEHADEIIERLVSQRGSIQRSDLPVLHLDIMLPGAPASCLPFAGYKTSPNSYMTDPSVLPGLFPPVFAMYGHDSWEFSPAQLQLPRSQDFGTGCENPLATYCRWDEDYDRSYEYYDFMLPSKHLQHFCHNLRMADTVFAISFADIAVLHMRVTEPFGHAFSIKNFSSLEGTLLTELRGFFNVRVEGPGIPSHTAVKLEKVISRRRCALPEDALMYFDDARYVAEFAYNEGKYEEALTHVFDIWRTARLFQTGHGGADLYATCGDAFKDQLETFQRSANLSMAAICLTLARQSTDPAERQQWVQAAYEKLSLHPGKFFFQPLPEPSLHDSPNTFNLRAVCLVVAAERLSLPPTANHAEEYKESLAKFRSGKFLISHDFVGREVDLAIETMLMKEGFERDAHKRFDLWTDAEKQEFLHVVDQHEEEVLGNEPHEFDIFPLFFEDIVPLIAPAPQQWQNTFQ